MSFSPVQLERLRELAALDLGADINDPELQALVDQAAAELELPVAAVSIIMDSAQYFIASHGLSGWLEAASGSPVEWAFCRHAVDRKEPFVVSDATQHELMADNPLVRNDGIRCYLGIPLITSRGLAVGTLCVLGTQSREFSADDVARLRGLADDALAVLEARRAD